MTKPKYKIIFAENSRYTSTCGKCDIDWCSIDRMLRCRNLGKSLIGSHSIYFKKVN